MKKETYIYGLRPVIEAIKAGKEFEKLLFQNRLKGETFRELFDLVRELEIPFQFVPVEKLNRLSRQNHQGVVGYVSEISYHKIHEVVPFAFETGKTPLLLVLDRITDIRNLGAIARTAECAGADALVLPSRGSAQINSDAIKTSAGALYKLPVVRSDTMRDTLRYLKESGITLVAATEKSGKRYTACDLARPVAIILGSEGEGITPEWLEMADEKIGIPLFGEIGSLNVSVAAGILLYETLRQRGFQSAEE